MMLTRGASPSFRTRGFGRRLGGVGVGNLRERRQRLEVGLAQGGVGELQAQPVEQEVVAGPGQVALGVEQLLLGVEHVDVDAHAHLVAQQVALEG